METENYEEKSNANWKESQDFKILKTIVAFANGSGGVITIKKISCDHKYIDSAMIDDFVNKWVLPRVSGITCQVVDVTGCMISVPASTQAPHVFTKEVSYRNEKGKDISVFYPGQIYVRHSSKTEPATGDDLQKIVANSVMRVLSAVGSSIQKFGVSIVENHKGIPLKLSQSEGALELGFQDVNKLYPFTPTQAGKKVGRGGPWFGSAVKALGLREDPNYCLQIGSGPNTVRRYNELTVDAVKARLGSEPNFSPY